MHPFFADYLERLITLHQDCLKSIEGLSTEALDWIPVQNPSVEMNAINVLVTHIVGAERYWIGDVACGDSSNRVRDEEFQVVGLDSAALTAKINAATSYAQSALEKLSLEDLSKESQSPRDSRTFTVGWALLHALEHTAIHLGHIQLTRQLWAEQDNLI
jgi:hypothetical protein